MAGTGMNILFIAPYVPSRIRVRPFHLIMELARRHRVHVIALGDSERSKIPGGDDLSAVVSGMQVIPHPKMRGYLQSLAAIATSTPMCTAFCRSSAMSAAVRDAVRSTSYDIIHVEHLRAAHFAPQRGDAPIVFDSVDCLSGLFGQMAGSRKGLLSRLVAGEESWKLRRYEPRTIRRFDRIVITSESERRELLSLDGNLPVQVLPNGVDTEYFSPQGDQRRSNRLVFSGKMSYAPNAEAAIWFAQKVLPAVRQAHGDTEFVIVGSDPPPEVRSLAQIPGVMVTGYVDDTRPFLDSASIAVVPMQMAVGIQNKVLEALAMGLPVVASSLSARTFGDAAPGIVRADSADEVATAVCRLIADRSAAEDIGRRGREAAVGSYSWQAVVDQLEQVYADAIGQ
jgi:sugar transferase (PEP-CTERM/EpsH1 system associated)